MRIFWCSFAIPSTGTLADHVAGAACCKRQQCLPQVYHVGSKRIIRAGSRSPALEAHQWHMAADHPLTRGAPSDLANRSFIGPPPGCLYYSRKTGFRFPSTAFLW